MQTAGDREEPFQRLTGLKEVERSEQQQEAEGSK